MAEKVRIRLQGGPCNGENATVERSGDLLPGFTCKGTDYQPTARTTPSGRVVYTTKEKQAADYGPTPTGDVHLGHAHSAWHHLLKRSFVDAPTELRRSAEARTAIRRLRHRQGLR